MRLFSAIAPYLCVLIVILQTVLAIGDEPKIDNVNSVDWRAVASDLNNVAPDACKQHQYYFDFFDGKPSGEYRSLRLIVERNNEQSAVLATSPHGFPLLFFSGDKGYSLSPKIESYRTFPFPGHELTLGAEASGTSKPSLVANIRLQSAHKDAKHKFTLAPLVDEFKRFPSSTKKTKCATVTKFIAPDRSAFSIVEYHDEETYGLPSFCFRVPDATTCHVYNITKDDRPYLSLLEHKRFELFMALSTSSKHVPVTVVGQAEPEDVLSMFIKDVDSHKLQSLSHGFQRQIVISNASIAKMMRSKKNTLRDALIMAFHELSGSVDQEDVITARLRKVLDEMRSDKEPLHFDPAMRAAWSQVYYGPMTVGNLFEKSAGILGDEKFSIATRRLAFEYVCLVGWPAHFDSVMLLHAEALKLTAPSSEYVYFDGIDWELVKLR